MIDHVIVRDKISENTRKLMEDYVKEIDEAYARIDDEDNKNDKLAITFKNTLGETKKGFEIKTTMSFVGTRTKDSITCVIDPNQPELPGMTGDTDAS